MKNLAYYLVANKKFYSFISHIGQDYDVTKFMVADKLKAYRIFTDEIYIKAMSNVGLPNQGWKIHISVTPQNAMDILKIAIHYLSANKISFKIVKNIDIYISTSGKAFSREQFGKFITIYPENVSRFKKVINDLYNLLSAFAGPEILTDKRYKDSKVIYYRYGGFASIVTYDSWGMPTYYIYDGYGNLVEDQRKPYYTLPPGVTDFDFHVQDLNQSRLFSSYKILKALHFSNTGGTYLAIQEKTNNTVIIKEARPYTQIDETGRDAIFFRKIEELTLRKLYGDELIPKYVEAFYDQSHYFLVEEYIDGITLYDFIANNNPFLRLDDENKVKEYLKKIVGWCADLYKFLLRLRQYGFIMHDLSTDNIIITSDGNLKVIDLEGVTKKKTSAKFLAKNDITRNKNCEYPDMCELGLILYSSLFLKDSLLQLDIKSIDYFFEYLETFYIIPHSFRRLIDKLVIEQNNICLNLEPLFNKVLLDLESKKAITKCCEHKRVNYIFGLYPRIISGLFNTYNRIPDSLFPLTPMYSNDLNISTGIFGIIYGLHTLGQLKNLEKLTAEYKKIEDNDMPNGLFSGWGGIVYVLIKIGKTDEAELIFTEHFHKRLTSLDFTLATGMAGDIIVLLELNHHTQKNEYLKLAINYGTYIIRSYDYEHNDKIGFAEGNAGIALALYYLYSITKNISFIEFGKKILDEEMKYAIYEKNYITFCATKNSKIRYPYFMMGTAGILAVILRYGRVDDRFNEYAVQLANGLHYGFTISADLFEGMAGIGNVLLDCYLFLGDKKYLDWAYDAACFCYAHRICDGDGNYVFVDHFLQRIAMDYGYGSIGIMLFLQRINNKTDNFALFDDLVEELLYGTEEQY